jgi:hypothetical protein
MSARRRILYLPEARHEERPLMKRHRLAEKYGLTEAEILDAIDGRFRLRVAVEGAIAEIQTERHIKALVGTAIDRYEIHDEDGKHDFSLWLPRRRQPVRVECKNVRNSNEAFRTGGQIVAYKVETQKTRASQGDPTSRLYDIDQFDVLAVCLGKKTGDWRQMLFVRTLSLQRQPGLPRKLKPIQRVPLPTDSELDPWFSSLAQLLADGQKTGGRRN